MNNGVTFIDITLYSQQTYFINIKSNVFSYCYCIAIFHFGFGQLTVYPLTPLVYSTCFLTMGINLFSGFYIVSHFPVAQNIVGILGYDRMTLGFKRDFAFPVVYDNEKFFSFHPQNNILLYLCVYRFLNFNKICVHCALTECINLLYFDIFDLQETCS